MSTPPSCRSWNRSGALALLFAALVPAGSVAAQADHRPPPGTMADVVEAIEALDRMRSTLASSLLQSDEPVDQSTFADVCRPVGQRAAVLSNDNPWTVRQMAIRYRNPAHEADDEARTVHRLMEDRSDLQAVWVRAQADGGDSYRYFRRITVEESYLSCHGTEEGRPEFIREGYPEDRAHGFEVGDLRGVYSVVVPIDGSGR